MVFRNENGLKLLGLNIHVEINGTDTLFLTFIHKVVSYVNYMMIIILP